MAINNAVKIFTGLIIGSILLFMIMELTVNQAFFSGSTLKELLIEDKELYFRLKPNISQIWEGDHVPIPESYISTDRYGYRKTKELDTDKIIVLGDSISFGWGVNDNELYPFILERLSGFDVINLAVPAYNTKNEIKMLELDGLKYNPRYVILQFTDNDFGDMQKIGKEKKFSSKLWSMLIYPRLKNSCINMRLCENTEKIYAEGIGLNDTLAAIDRLYVLSEDNGFEVIFFKYNGKNLTYPHGLDKVIAKVKRYNFTYISIESLQNKDIEISWRDKHPNAYGHELMADNKGADWFV